MTRRTSRHAASVSHCKLATGPHGEQQVCAGTDASEANEAAGVRGT